MWITATFTGICEHYKHNRRSTSASRPHMSLFLSGVTPFSRVLHHFPDGVMLPNWCNAPQPVQNCPPHNAVIEIGTQRLGNNYSLPTLDSTARHPDSIHMWRTHDLSPVHQQKYNCDDAPALRPAHAPGPQPLPRPGHPSREPSAPRRQRHRGTDRRAAPSTGLLPAHPTRPRH